MAKSLLVAALLTIGLAGCVPATKAISEISNLTPVQTLMNTDLPAMQWDARADAPIWTRATLMAVATQDASLAGLVPADIATYCPRYAENNLHNRRAFWVGLLSAVAKYESSWNPGAVGGGGRYVGMMQISTKTAAHHGCSAQSKDTLKDGTANLACAVTIMATQVGRDGLVAGKGNRGIARDWGPMMKPKTRARVADWTRAQSYCKA